MFHGRQPQSPQQHSYQQQLLHVGPPQCVGQQRHHNTSSSTGYQQLPSTAMLQRDVRNAATPLYNSRSHHPPPYQEHSEYDASRHAPPPPQDRGYRGPYNMEQWVQPRTQGSLGQYPTSGDRPLHGSVRGYEAGGVHGTHRGDAAYPPPEPPPHVLVHRQHPVPFAALDPHTQHHQRIAHRVTLAPAYHHAVSQPPYVGADRPPVGYSNVSVDARHNYPAVERPAGRPELEPSTACLPYPYNPSTGQPPLQANNVAHWRGDDFTHRGAGDLQHAPRYHDAAYSAPPQTGRGRSATEHHGGRYHGSLPDATMSAAQHDALRDYPTYHNQLPSVSLAGVPTTPSMRHTDASLDHNRSVPDYGNALAYGGHALGALAASSATYPPPPWSSIAPSPSSAVDEHEGPQVIVNYLAPTVTSAELQRLFSCCGAVESARVIYDRESGATRGYGFVYFRTVDSARIAVAHMNGFYLLGKWLRVSYSQNPLPLPTARRRRGTAAAAVVAADGVMQEGNATSTHATYPVDDSPSDSEVDAS